MFTGVFVLFILIPAIDCRGHRTSEFNRIWNDVVSKLDSKDSGIGPFENAAKEFGPTSKDRRFEIFKENHHAEKSLLKKIHKRALNFFALLDEAERGRYLSGPTLTMMIVWKELYKFYQQPNILAPMEKRDFSKILVNTRHNGAHNSRGIMAAVMHLEYLYKYHLDMAGSENSIFSSQYFLNCIKNEEPMWPHEVWSTLKDHPFAAGVDSSGMDWNGRKEECVDTPPNKWDDLVSLTSYHMLGIWPSSMTAHLDRGPLTICVRVDVNDFDFFFYHSGLYSDLKMGSLFEPCNHFVLLVSYEEDYFVLQNTWGVDWGTNGKMYVARGSIETAAMKPFLIFYPVLKLEEGPMTGFGGNTHVAHIKIWGQSNPVNSEDFLIAGIMEEGQIFEVRSNSTAELKEIYLEVGFMILTHLKSLYYGISVNFKDRNIRQYANLHDVGSIDIYDQMTEAMLQPDTLPVETVLRIKVEAENFATLLNDEPLTKFPHQHDFREINLVEVRGDGGEVEVVQLARKVVPNGIFPNSGGGQICRDKELKEDCEFWGEMGYCGVETVSRYGMFVRENCPMSCGTC